MLRVLGDQDNIVNCDVRSFWNVGSLDGDGAFGRVHVPDLRKRGGVLKPRVGRDGCHVVVHLGLYADELLIYLHGAICRGADGKLAVV